MNDIHVHAPQNKFVTVPAENKQQALDKSKFFLHSTVLKGSLWLSVLSFPDLYFIDTLCVRPATTSSLEHHVSRCVEINYKNHVWHFSHWRKIYRAISDSYTLSAINIYRLGKVRVGEYKEPCCYALSMMFRSLDVFLYSTCLILWYIYED